MASVTGIGGIFLKVDDPDATRRWYEDHLGIETADYGGWPFRWRKHDDPEVEGWTEWSLFPSDTDYFDPSDAPVMVNYRVDDLDGLLKQLKDEGIEQVGDIESYSYGRFAWILDPNGLKIELWEPADDPAEEYGE